MSITPDPGLANRGGPIRCQSRLGGLLNYYGQGGLKGVSAEFLYPRGLCHLLMCTDTDTFESLAKSE